MRRGLAARHDARIDTPHSAFRIISSPVASLPRRSAPPPLRTPAAPRSAPGRRWWGPDGGGRSDDQLRRRDGEGAGQALEQSGRALLALGDLVSGEAGAPRHFVHELVVDKVPPQRAGDQLRNVGAARAVLAGDRDDGWGHQGGGRRWLCRLRRISPRLRTGRPPSVGTMMMRLSEPFISRSTSRYCLVSASGVRVWFNSRTCSAWSRATSTRCRSVSTCCSCAILLLIAWTTCAGGCRSRRKKAVTVAMRNFPTPPRGWVTRAESVSASMVRAIWVRLEMSLIEYCTIPSRTPLRMAFSTAPRIWSSLPISV